MIGGLAVLGAAGYGYYWMRSNNVRLPVDKPQELVLAAGTPVSLIVLEPLSSGGSEVGEKVKLMVSEDVKVGKDVAIPRGTEATGEVTRSRSGSVLGSVSNQPARLEIKLIEMEVNGKSVKIRSAGGEVHAFTQANTVGKQSSENLDAALKDPEKRKTLEELASKVKDGEKGLSITDLAGVDFKGLNETFTLPETDEFLSHIQKTRIGSKDEEKTADAVERIFGGLASGNLGDVVGLDRVLAAKALGEISNLGRKADQKLRGIFKGRNIWVEIGTPVQAKISSQTKIKS